MKRIFLASSILVVSAFGSANAADMGYAGPGDMGQTFVEYGSGWYLRGDISWNKSGRQEKGFEYFSDVDANLFYDYNDGLGLRGGFGYHINNNFRIDATAEHLFGGSFANTIGRQFGGRRAIELIDAGTGTTVDDEVIFDRYGNVLGTANGNNYPHSTVGTIAGTEEINASYNANNYMVNGYFDLGRFGRFTPYVGAGVGMANVSYSESRDRTCEPTAATDTCNAAETVDIDYSTDYWTMSYQLSAGTAIALTNNLALDVGYSYLQVGEGESVNYRDGTAINPDGFNVHKVSAGLRYSLW